MNGQFVLVLAITAVAVFGVWRWYTDGRVTAADREHFPGIELGSGVTLVQFSSRVCSPCHAARRVLSAVAEREDVSYQDLDVEQHMELVQRFDVTRTPTVLVLDASGHVRHRVVGVPRPAELETAIAALTGVTQDAR